MFKFIKGKGVNPNVERQKLQKELFSYSRTLQHGFPHKPTAMAWDPVLRLICIGSATGAIKVFGRPGVEFYGQHQVPIAVTKLVFLPSQGRVVSLCDDNSLHLWEINKSSLVEVKNQALEGKLKKVSTLCVESCKKHLLLGTEGGNIYLLDLATFTMTPDIIYQDVVMQNVPQDYKLNPGAVESILEQPEHPKNILIGYNRGLIVLWNKVENTAIKTFVASQQLESLCWQDCGRLFCSSHNDGTYVQWDIEKPESPSPEPNNPYGPFPCRTIPKIYSKQFRGQQLTVFSGGLARASYSDKYTVSVVLDDQHVVFDFTSKVIDFFVIDSKVQESEEDHNENEVNNLTNGTSNKGEPEALIVLADEELVAIDLESKEWKMMSLPYLVSLHASAITCSQYVSGVPEELWEQLKEAGRAQTSHLYSTKPWPIDGGALLCSKGAKPRRELLLTGHEDGTVRFWDAGDVSLTPIYKFSSSQYFTVDGLDAEVSPEVEDTDDEDFPNFRKTGVFDPYSDDPRFAIKKVVMCPLSGTLIVAGTAGQVVIAQFDTEILQGQLSVSSMNIVNDRDGFIWKGHSELTPKQDEIRQTRGFQTTAILQILPPAAITCTALHADWGLVAAGTAHGIALYDYTKNKPVLVKCTLNPNDLTGAGDAPISRRKSFKKSLRESFRRLRKGRSQRRSNTPGAQTNTPVATSPPHKRIMPEENPGEAKPVERQIEARPVDDAVSSYVRCLYFARTFLLNVQHTVPTLWAGTNNGTVYAFTISVPDASKRDKDDVVCLLAKEIQLKHRAPVIAIAVLDGSNKPLPEPLEVVKAVAPLPDATHPHRVVIASEEQFKIFTLPSLKPFCKYKLTAHEGARVRKMSFAAFGCNYPEDKEYSEIDLLCLTNLGDCLILSIPDLKRQLNAAAIKREDINGISSLVFTKNAEALYLHSSSELQRISLSARYSTRPRCYLIIPSGARGESTSQAGSEEDCEGNKEVLIETQLVNGIESKESSLADKVEDVKENGEETTHNVTVSSSVGDITIDSVKDHLGSGESLNNRHISGLCVTKTVTTIISNSQEGAVTSSATTTTTVTANQENS